MGLPLIDSSSGLFAESQSPKCTYIEFEISRNASSMILQEFDNIVHVDTQLEIYCNMYHVMT